MDNAGTLKKIEKEEAKRKSDKIAKFLSSDEDEIVCAALAAMGRIGDEFSVNNVCARIDNPNATIRKAAINAIGEIGTEYSKTLLQQRYAAEQDEDVKELILTMIRKINDNKR